jgi:hypothetical protein
LVGAAVVVGVVPSLARADVGVREVRPASARPGDIVEVRATTDPTFGPPAPLYLVPKTSAPFGSPKVRRAPTERPFVRIGLLDFRHTKEIHLRLKVPELPTGSYYFVLYCAPCYRGLGGSLVTSEVSLRVREPVSGVLSRERGRKKAGSGFAVWVVVGFTFLALSLLGLRRVRSSRSRQGPI